MITKIIHAVFNTDSLPVIGGAAGALTQTKEVVYFPSPDAVIYTICIALIGATVGYLIKIFLDWLFAKINKNK
jgi:hypothetical protein